VGIDPCSTGQPAEQLRDPSRFADVPKMQSKLSEKTENQQVAIDDGAALRPHKNRRYLLAAIVGGATVTIWKKPVIDSVLLPAHAQTSPGVTSGASAPGSGGTTASSGSSSSTGGAVSPVDSSSGGSSSSGSSSGGSSSSSSSSGSSSGGGSSGGGSGPDPKLTLLPPSYTDKTLSAGACIENCDATDILVIVDLYDSEGSLLGSFQNNLDVAPPQCLTFDVTSDTFGFSKWNEGSMFALGVSVPDCGLQESTSGFFTNVSQQAASSGSGETSKSQ